MRPADPPPIILIPKFRPRQIAYCGEICVRCFGMRVVRDGDVLRCLECPK